MRKVTKHGVVCLGVLAVFVAGFSFAAEGGRKKFTVKGSTSLDSKLNMNLSKSVIVETTNAMYSGTLGEKDDLSFRSSLAFGAEYAFLRFGQFEILGGFTLPQKYKATRLHQTISLPYVGEASGSASLDDGDFELNLTPLYLKPRFFFSPVSAEDITAYAAIKLSYNYISISGDMPIYVDLENNLGYGASIGLVFFDGVDAEISYDCIQGGILDSVDEKRSASNNYSFSSMYVSLGYRI
jgi:hypothetical protein